MKIAAVLVAVLAALLGVSLLHSRGNRVNFNRNSASVALILRLIQECDPNASTALVLVDQCCNSYEGLKLLKEACPSRAEVILLDCLAQGEKELTSRTCWRKIGLTRNMRIRTMVCGSSSAACCWHPARLRSISSLYGIHVLNGIAMWISRA